VHTGSSSRPDRRDDYYFPRASSSSAVPLDRVSQEYARYATCNCDLQPCIRGSRVHQPLPSHILITTDPSRLEDLTRLESLDEAFSSDLLSLFKLCLVVLLLFMLVDIELLVTVTFVPQVTRPQTALRLATQSQIGAGMDSGFLQIRSMPPSTKTAL
jgi:hypothetical protein